MAKTDWNPLLRGELDEPYWAELQSFVAAERAAGTVYPPAEETFAALHLTAYADVKVVLLGQDPYHGPGQAHGLCFSVRPPTPPPPSLRNIFTELSTDLGLPHPDQGSLVPWARQGVLLLNTTLTVRAGQAGSHQGRGWERFTDAVLAAVDAKPDRVVFLLWGSSARKRSRSSTGPGTSCSKHRIRPHCRHTGDSSGVGRSRPRIEHSSKPEKSRSTGPSDQREQRPGRGRRPKMFREKARLSARFALPLNARPGGSIFMV